jgi:hypothetical protein
MSAPSIRKDVTAENFPSAQSISPTPSHPVAGWLRHEWTTVVWAATVLAAVMTWPTLRHPLRTIPQDTYDPTLQAWQIAWGGHALIRRPWQLWNPNATFPEHLSLAFSDSLMGYAPFAVFGSGPETAVLRYNLLFVLTFAVATVGMYALLRQLGAGPAAAVVIAVAFAYSPWRFAHAGHLNILSTGGIPLALAMLARGHGWSLTTPRRSEVVRPRWALAGWLVAGWQITLGFGLGLPFAYLLAGLVLVAVGTWWRRGRPALPTRLWQADLVGVTAFTGITLLMGVPYLLVLAEHPDARRSIAWLDLLSPPMRGFFVAGEHSWLWGPAQQTARAELGFAGEMTLLPGFTLLALALLGLVVSTWPGRARLVLAAGVLLSAWFAMGTAAPAGGHFGYLLLYRFLPGFDGSRTPGRLVLWTILLLGVLAAGALNELVRRRTRFPHLPRYVLVLALLAVTAEGVNRTPHEDVPIAPVALSGLAAPILVLPTGELEDLHVMLWSTAGFPTVVNGSSGYNPPSREALREELTTFPDAQSVNRLRSLGVRTVVVLPQATGTRYEFAQQYVGAQLGLERTEVDGTVVFTL